MSRKKVVSKQSRRERALSYEEALVIARPGMRMLLDFGQGPFYYTVGNGVRPGGERALMNRLLAMEFETPSWAKQHEKWFE